MSSAGGSFSHMSLHVGSDWTVRCSTYADNTPILTLDAGESAVPISIAKRDATEAAVEFAGHAAKRRYLTRGFTTFATSTRQRFSSTASPST